MRNLENKTAVIFGNKLADAAEVHKDGIEYCLANMKAVITLLGFYNERTQVKDPEINHAYTLLDTFCDTARDLNDLKKEEENKAA